MLQALVLLLVAGTSSAFVFPDMKQRSGAAGPAYKVAVLEEEPYLFSNGTGYVPDLLRHVSRAYGTAHGGKELQLEIVPVKTWKQLMTKAKSTRFQVAFGLQIPSLQLTNWPGKLLHSTAPAVHTSLKIVTRGIVGEETDNRRIRGNQVVLLKDSPVEHLVVGADSYQGSVYFAETVDAAVEYVSTAIDDAVFLTDAGTADRIAEKESRDLRSICLKDNIPGSHSVHHAFFGKDNVLLGHLNDAILYLTENDSLFPIQGHYFPASTQCPM